MAWRFHLFPYRTQKLSSNAPKVLGWKRPGRRGRRRIPRGAFTTVGVFFFCALCAKQRRGARLRGALAQGMRLRAEMHAVFYERVAARCAVFCGSAPARQDERRSFATALPRGAPARCGSASVLPSCAPCSATVRRDARRSFAPVPPRGAPCSAGKASPAAARRARHEKGTWESAPEAGFERAGPNRPKVRLRRPACVETVRLDRICARLAQQKSSEKSFSDDLWWCLRDLNPYVV